MRRRDVSTMLRRAAMVMAHRSAALGLVLVPLLCAAAVGGERAPEMAIDQVAYAVDGAESSHGRDGGMWRPDPGGPQGPMQVSARAATDVGGGDRFDVGENRALGRAYLAQLYRRYGNWADAIAAYNWGIGNLDTWIKAGRPADRLLTGVAAYLRRVLRDSGLCGDGGAIEECAAEMLGPDGAGMRVALAGGEATGGGGRARLYRKLAVAEALAKEFGAQQAALEHSLSGRP